MGLLGFGAGIWCTASWRTFSVTTRDPTFSMWSITSTGTPPIIYPSTLGGSTITSTQSTARKRSVRTTLNDLRSGYADVVDTALDGLTHQKKPRCAQINLENVISHKSTKSTSKADMLLAKKHIIDIFRPQRVFLPDDLLYLILEIAGLANVGRSLSTFTIYFPRLIQTKHVSLDDPRDENVPPK